MVQEVVLLNLIEYTTSDLEERRMRIAEIYACVLLYLMMINRTGVAGEPKKTKNDTKNTKQCTI